MILLTSNANGNIETISENGILKATYTYDGLNQLVREDSVWLNRSVVYTYDEGGNILSEEGYPYTLGAIAGSPGYTTAFDYQDSEWGDLLTEFMGMPITYDAMGNTTGMMGHTLTWKKGRQLDTISGNGIYAEYKYNQNGLRTQKVVNNVTTDFYYAGNLLMAQNDGANLLVWTYDASGQMVGFKCNDVSYYYLRNLQGDIIGIYNSDGEIVCRYNYDAWGYHQDRPPTDANGNEINDPNHIANINPIRYRGYYYDAETTLYYLQSRYYCAGTRRFMNADALFIAGDSLTGTNMFAYCNNNPVMFCDPTGYYNESNVNDALSKIIASKGLTDKLSSFERRIDHGRSKNGVWWGVATYTKGDETYKIYFGIGTLEEWDLEHEVNMFDIFMEYISELLGLLNIFLSVFGGMSGTNSMAMSIATGVIGNYRRLTMRYDIAVGVKDGYKKKFEGQNISEMVMIYEFTYTNWYRTLTYNPAVNDYTTGWITVSYAPTKTAMYYYKP